MPVSQLKTDQRSRPRYELDLELKFSYRLGKRTYLGSGRARNFSDNVICFESDQELPGTVDLELEIAWPYSLQGLFPLDMIIRGGLLRKQQNVVALQMDSYEFRTRDDRAFHARTSRGALCDLVV